MPLPRPRDLFSAAFLDDTQRLHFLATQGVPGGYHDDEEGELEEEEEQAIDQDEELVRLKKLYIPSADEEEEQGNEDDMVEDEDDGYSQEAAEEREQKVERFRKLIRRKIRRQAIAKKLNVTGLIKTGLTPVDMHEYGVMFRSKPRLPKDRFPRTGAGTEAVVAPCSTGHSSEPATEKGGGRAVLRPPHAPYHCSADPLPHHAANFLVEVCDDDVPASAAQSDVSLLLTVHWKPSKRSRFPAYPLHWAVMGRSHGAIQFLVLHGADPDLVVEDTSGVFPKGLAARHIAEANGLRDTLEVLATATAAYQKLLQDEETEKQRIESELEQIKAIKERRKMEREQRAADRRAAEEAEEAAAAAVDEAEEEAEEEDYEDE